MPWTWVRPADPAVLAGRPLLDLGTGDGQTLAALTGNVGFVVGIDRSEATLRAARRSGNPRLAVADATALPFVDEAFATVLAGDLFHHLEDQRLGAVLMDAARVLRRGGSLCAWWYGAPSRQGPDAPGFPRSFDDVAAAATAAGFECGRLDLVTTTDAPPQTVGLVAARAEA